MKNPNPVNLQTSADIRQAGWQAECRDADGHLCRTHAPFETDEEIVWLVREALEHGETVTIWPDAIVADTPSPSPQVLWGEKWPAKKSPAKRGKVSHMESSSNDRRPIVTYKFRKGSGAPRLSNALSQNARRSSQYTSLAGRLDECLTGLFQRLITFKCSYAFKLCKLVILTTLDRPTLRQIVERFRWATDRRNHSATNLNVDWLAPNVECGLPIPQHAVPPIPRGRKISTKRDTAIELLYLRPSKVRIRVSGTGNSVERYDGRCETLLFRNRNHREEMGCSPVSGTRALRAEQHRPPSSRNAARDDSTFGMQLEEIGQARCSLSRSVSGCTYEHSAISANDCNADDALSVRSRASGVNGDCPDLGRSASPAPSQGDAPVESPWKPGRQ